MKEGDIQVLQMMVMSNWPSWLAVLYVGKAPHAPRSAVISQIAMHDGFFFVKNRVPAIKMLTFLLVCVVGNY